MTLSHRTAATALCVALAFTTASCGELDTDAMTDDLAGVELGEEGKADSARLPTAKGALSPGRAAVASLGRTAGFHTYTFAGRNRAKVKFTLKSRLYRTYLRVTSPAGTRWNVPGVRDRNGDFVSTIELTLRLDGAYKLLATSYNNMYYGTARTVGAYALEAAVANQPCGGIAGLACPADQKCLLDGSYPDAGGTCVAQDACRVAADCEGNVHPECVGAWACEGATGTTTGTCSFACQAPSECDGLSTSACAANPRCEIAARGCENNTCDPAIGPCHPCDPIPVCVPRTAGREGDACGGRGQRACADGLYCAYSLGAICGWADAAGACARRPSLCTANYSPVCGCDGRTYANACTAASAGQSAQASGECPR